MEAGRGISTLHYGTGSDILTARMENRLLSNLLARLKTWDPDPGVLVREISTLHYGMGNDISTALLLSFLPARFKEWDQGVTSCVREKNTQQAEHKWYMKTVNTGQQGVKMAVMRGQEDSCITKEMYQHKSVDKVYAPIVIMEKVIRMLLWDTGQLYKTVTEVQYTGQEVFKFVKK